MIDPWDDFLAFCEVNDRYLELRRREEDARDELLLTYAMYDGPYLQVHDEVITNRATARAIANIMRRYLAEQPPIVLDLDVGVPWGVFLR